MCAWCKNCADSAWLWELCWECQADAASAKLSCSIVRKSDKQWRAWNMEIPQSITYVSLCFTLIKPLLGGIRIFDHALSLAWDMFSKVGISAKTVDRAERGGIFFSPWASVGLLRPLFVCAHIWDAILERCWKMRRIVNNMSIVAARALRTGCLWEFMMRKWPWDRIAAELKSESFGIDRLMTCPPHPQK